MWKDLDMEAMAAEEYSYSGPRSREEVEEIVVMARLKMWNRCLPCGAPALRKRLDEHYHLRPLPSVRTIGRILARTELVNW